MIKYAFALLLFHCGDIISWFINWEGFAFLYPVYNWCMTKSFELDENERIWTLPDEKRK